MHAGLAHAVPFVLLAHLGHPVVRAERAIALTLTDAPTLTYVVQLSAGESARARTAADTDGDGTISTVEGNAQVDRWTALLSREVKLAKGRGSYSEPHPLSELKVVNVEASGMVGANDDKTMIRVAWTFRLPTLGEDDRLRLDDALASSFGTAFEHTEFRVQDTPERPLIGVGDDPNVLSSSPQLAWVDAVHPARSIYVLWRPREKKLFPIVPVVFAIAIVSLGAIAWLTRRRTPREP